MFWNFAVEIEFFIICIQHIFQSGKQSLGVFQFIYCNFGFRYSCFCLLPDFANGFYFFHSLYIAPPVKMLCQNFYIIGEIISHHTRKPRHSFKVGRKQFLKRICMHFIIAL